MALTAFRSDRSTLCCSLIRLSRASRACRCLSSTPPSLFAVVCDCGAALLCESASVAWSAFCAERRRACSCSMSSASVSATVPVSCWMLVRGWIDWDVALRRFCSETRKACCCSMRLSRASCACLCLALGLTRLLVDSSSNCVCAFMCASSASLATCFLAAYSASACAARRTNLCLICIIWISRFMS